MVEEEVKVILIRRINTLTDMTIIKVQTIIMIEVEIIILEIIKVMIIALTKEI